MKSLKQMFEESSCTDSQIDNIVEMLAGEVKSEAAAAEEFDRMTAAGYKLDLLTGEYYKAQLN